MHGTMLKLGSSLIAAMLLIGCSSDPKEDQYFKDATPQIQRAWIKAVTEEKDGEYMSAAETYDEILHMKISADQKRRVEIAISKMYTHVVEAAGKGDAKAKETLNTINANAGDTKH